VAGLFVGVMLFCPLFRTVGLSHVCNTTLTPLYYLWKVSADHLGRCKLSEKLDEVRDIYIWPRCYNHAAYVSGSAPAVVFAVPLYFIAVLLRLRMIRERYLPA
jgi:hypothetical protein